MDAELRTATVERLHKAFGGAADVTPGDGQPLHVRFAALELPEPWTPSPTRALAIFGNWPNERPLFYVGDDVRGESGQPPTNPHNAYHAGENWMGFSFSFPWSGSDVIRAIQLWMTRFNLRA